MFEIRRTVFLVAPLVFSTSARAETFLEVGGVVSMEAEHFTMNDGYTVRSDNGPNNVAAGWSGSGWVFSDSSSAHRLNFQITFTQTGTYYLHLRALAGFNADWSSNFEGLDNGFHAELDGTRISGQGIYVTKQQQWSWYGQPQHGSSSDPISFSVNSPGLHVFSIVRREELSRLDKIVIHDGTYGTNASSSLSGTGPAETINTGTAVDAGQPDAVGIDAGTGPVRRIEAESMGLQVYRVEDGTGYASNNAMITLKGGSDDETGAATAHVAEAGRFAVVLGYFDENDGEAELRVQIDGTLVDHFTLNQNLPDNRASAQTRVRRTVAPNIALSGSSVVVITGTETTDEPARVDYLELIPLGTPNPDAHLPDASAPDVSDPADAAALDVFDPADASDPPVADVRLKGEANGEAGCACSARGSGQHQIPNWMAPFLRR